MNYTFTNGTDEQKELWARAAHLLLNMPFDELPFDITVEFDTGEVIDAAGHDSTAVTFTTYGSTTALTKVRNDAPGYGSIRASLVAEAAAMGLQYNALLHYNETAVHEMGHVAFAALSEASRLKICAMFGSDTDENAVINDPADEWADRVVEGIAETFKEAFLPARFRVFPNRTRKKIPYSLYPAFRKVFRGGGAGFSYVYGSEDFRRDLSAYGLTRLPYHESGRDNEAFVYYEEIKGFEECFGVDMSQFALSGTAPFSIEPDEGEIIDD